MTMIENQPWLVLVAVLLVVLSIAVGRFSRRKS
jgi:hypothetical protein